MSVHPAALGFWRKQNEGLAESGTLGSRPVPLDTLSRSGINKMRLHNTRPHKRIKRGNYLDYNNFRNHYQNIPVRCLGFF